jgi:hypothetical protein
MASIGFVHEKEQLPNRPQLWKFECLSIIDGESSICLGISDEWSLHNPPQGRP